MEYSGWWSLQQKMSYSSIVILRPCVPPASSPGGGCLTVRWCILKTSAWMSLRHSDRSCFWVWVWAWPFHLLRSNTATVFSAEQIELTFSPHETSFFGGWRCTLIASYRKYRFSTFSSWYSYGNTLMQTPRICYASFKFLENEAIMSYEHRLIPTFSFDCCTTSNMCIFENYFVIFRTFLSFTVAFHDLKWG